MQFRRIYMYEFKVRKSSTDTARRAVRLRQLSFLLVFDCRIETEGPCTVIGRHVHCKVQTWLYL